MKHRYVANPPAHPGLLPLSEQLAKEMLAKMGEQFWQGSLGSASTNPQADFDAKAAQVASPFGGERHLYVEMPGLDAHSPLYKLQVPPEARVVFGPQLMLLDPAVERCLHQLGWPVLHLNEPFERRITLMRAFWPDSVEPVTMGPPQF